MTKTVENIPVLKLPSKARGILSAPQGTLYISRKRVVKGLKVYYAVGDYVSQTLEYRIGIVDYKTRRIRYVKPVLMKPIVQTINPRGTLSINTKTILKQGRIGSIVVRGEEDLVPIGIVLEKQGYKIAYGQPGIGVVIITSDPIRGRRLLKILQPDTTRIMED